MERPGDILQQIETIIDEEQAKSSTNSPHTLDTMSPALNALITPHSPLRNSSKNTPQGLSRKLNSIDPPLLNLSGNNNEKANNDETNRAKVLEDRKKRQADKKAAKLLRKQQAKARATQKASINKKNNTDKKKTQKLPKKPELIKINKSQDKRFDDPVAYAKHVKGQLINRVQVQKQVPLFSHLEQYEKETSLSLQVSFSNEAIHPAILRVGLHFTTGNIVGANARCIAMLLAMKEFISDYKVPPNKAISRDLSLKLKPIVRFLKDCRPNSISMGSAIRYLKAQVIKIPTSMNESEAKQKLMEYIDSFIHLRIQLADEVISNTGAEKISDGDVILTYAKSTVVEAIIKRAYDSGKNIKVICVDCCPKFEGRILLNRLLDHGISCTYITINAVAYVMKDVSLVLLGANAMLSNGTVLSRVGSAVVAMLANEYNKPLLVCCETYKLSERVQVDAITFNELGDPDALAYNEMLENTSHSLADWRDYTNLKLLNLTYDLIPQEYVSMVVTEIGVIPSTSVPVVVREYYEEIN